LAEAALDEARRYVKEREAFGRPIGSFQVTKHKLARMGAHTFLADQVDEVHYLLHEAQRVRSSAQSYRADTPVDDGE
jgi:alkylation response protein AidB-like acyl-CoA dehydrogenase